MSAPISHPVPDGAVSPSAGALPGATRDAQSITRDWQLLREPIAGVDVREVKNILKDNGCLTEVWRDDWGLRPSGVAQVFQALIEPRGISAWHVHGHATDRLFASHGHLKIVLYDARPQSASKGRINVFHCGTARPMLIVVPPGVWHGVQNVGAVSALLLNLPDHAYAYEAPDHWRLPPDNDQIPYSFTKAGGPQRGDPGQF